jgi:hypothetical protein
MSASTRPFLELEEELTFFVRAAEVRLFNIVTSSDDRAAVLAQVQIAEGNAYNRSPFAILEDADSDGEDGWFSRAERLRAIHEERRAGLAEEGGALPELPPCGPFDDGLDRFSFTAAQILSAHAHCPPLSGAVAVLAPTQMADARRFEAGVRRLLETPGLDALRLIVIDADAPSVEGVLRDLGEERGMQATCRVDPAELRREQERRIARIAAASPSAPLEVQLGFAGPNVTPPPRPGKEAPQTVPPAAGQALGPAAALAGPLGAEVRRLVYAGAHALQSGRGEEALRFQQAAATHCYDAGLEREGCLMELTLAAYLVQLELRHEAREVYTRAGARAERIDPALAARAYLGLGAAWLLDRNTQDAANAYARAADLAEAAGEPLVTLEALRLAGQVALDAGASDAAIATWRRAVALAEGVPATQVAVSSAPTIARALAALLDRRGLHDSAVSLLQQADRFEAAAHDPGPSE